MRPRLAARLSLFAAAGNAGGAHAANSRRRTARARGASPDGGRSRRRPVPADRIGATAQVLVEQQQRGRTEHYAPIRLTTPAPDGALLTVQVTGRDADGLLATAVS